MFFFKKAIILTFVLNVTVFFVAFAESGNTMTYEQMTEAKSKAQNMVNSMKSILQSGYDMLQKARSSKDVGELTCVNEALTTIKGLVKHSEMNLLNLNEAYANKNPKAFQESYIKIEVAYDKVKDMKGQLLSCGVSGKGEGTIEGKTEVITDFDTDLPEINTDKVLEDIQTYEVTTPPSASPFL